MARYPTVPPAYSNSCVYLPHFAVRDRLRAFRSIPQLPDMGGPKASIGVGTFGSAGATMIQRTTNSNSSSRLSSEDAGTPLPSDQHTPEAFVEGFQARILPQEPADAASQAAPSTWVFDPEMDDLAKRLNENVLIRDMATKSPTLIQVPKGYVMAMEVKPSTFYESREIARTRIKKRKRESGTLPKLKRREWRHERHGFRPQEVNWNGAVHLKNCKPSSLSNEIHPLLDRSCFDDTPDAIYDQLIPGLQLASMFLTQHVCQQFWVTLAMGHRKDDITMSLRHRKRCQRIDKHVELTESRAREVIENINTLAKSRLIHFAFKHRPAPNCWAVSSPIKDYEGIGKECGANNYGPTGSLVRSIIELHADVYTTAKKLSQLKYPEISQQLRFSFFVAVLIMHELVSFLQHLYLFPPCANISVGSFH